MTLRDIVEHASTQLYRNARRSMIAMLGLIVGVAALVTLDTLGRTTSFYLMSFIASLGQAQIVQVRALGLKGLGSGARSFTQADVDRMRWELQDVATVAAVVTDVESIITCGERSMQVRLAGIDEEYGEMFGLKVVAGRHLHREDSRRRAPVAILGAELGEMLPPGRAEAHCVVQGVPVRVVGRLGPSLYDPVNRTVFVPLPTALSRFHDCRKLDTLLASADSLEGVAPLAAALRRDFARRDPRGLQSYEVRFNESAIQRIQDALLVLKIFVVVVGLVTLLLGGFGIMNVFLSSLAERTAEMGIRKAVGASEEEIVAQILAEALALCLLSSGLGVALGLASVRIVVSITGHAELAVLAWPRISAIALFASAVGATFALSPALQTARKDIIDAIRGT